MKIKSLKKIPAPLIVVLLSIGFSQYLKLDLTEPHQYTFNASTYELNDKFLVNVPKSLIEAVTYPDFSEVFTGTGFFWIMMFCLIGSLESILSAKAVDLLDPWKRRTNFDRDLLGVGIANTIAAAIGGLPMISEIVRSRANIDNGANNRFSNMFHGLFLFLFLMVAPGLLHQIPLSALAAILVFTGFRLASPKEFIHMYHLGLDQLAVFLGTIIMVLATDLLIGILFGACLEVFLHLVRGIGFKSLFKPTLEVVKEGQRTVVKASDSVVFTTWIAIKRRLQQIDAVEQVVVDLSATAIVDHTVLSKLEDMRRDWSTEGRDLKITGLENHSGTSSHPLSCHRRNKTAS